MNKRIWVIFFVILAGLVLAASGAALAQNNQLVVSPDMELGEAGSSYKYENMIGVTSEPYLADTDHLNTPHGVYIDSEDNLFVTEIWAHRLLEYDDNGNSILTIGAAGRSLHHDNFLASPRDTTIDNEGNIWVVMLHAVKQFDSSGAVLQIFPVDDPWQNGQDNGHFDTPYGIAFDSTGLMYVADTNNHRIQILDISSGSPVYTGTIGITGEPRSDDTGFDTPHRIAFDSLGRLYVADTANYRIQRCTKTTEWTCETFFGITDEPGSDLDHLGWACGLDIRDDEVYIGDTGNYRVLKCNLAGDCADFAGESTIPGADDNHFQWPTDVAVDSTGKVYVADEANHRVQIFDNSGSFIDTRGVTLVPYIVDEIHLYSPWGVAIANDGGLVVTEQGGRRVIKYNTGMSQEWTSDGGEISYYSNIEGNPTQDNSGKIYFSDSWNHRVVILSSSGDYLDSFGVLGEPGDDETHFDVPQSIAISPITQDIYVVDKFNQRIQVFDQDYNYITTLGITDEPGSDDLHFNNPRGIAIDALGYVYVADTDNYRVQKCTMESTSYTCITFAGETGVFDDSFEHIFPTAVAVGADGKVYVTDEWNARVQVYSIDGEYLTTIGGGNGTTSSQFDAPLGIAIDDNGNVFVADTNNHRIQVFSPGYPGWKQVNINGFGKRWNIIALSMEQFDEMLYVGTLNGSDGAEVWRTADGKTWEQANESGFGEENLDHNNAVIDLAVFGDDLYASTGWGVLPGQIWRTSDGLNWELVEDYGFDDPGSGGINIFGIFGDELYVSMQGDEGVEIWRSTTGDAGDWARVVENGNGDSNNGFITDLIEFDGEFYAMVQNNADPKTGLQIWQSTDGETWTAVVSDGFGDPENYQAGGAAIFNGMLYVGTRNESSGGEIWRSTDGVNWDQAASGGLDDVNNLKIENIFVYNGKIFATTGNESGMLVYSSPDGTNWTRLVENGFGDVNTDWSGWTGVDFKGRLYLGATNDANGAKVWQMLGNDIYLPLVTK